LAFQRGAQAMAEKAAQHADELCWRILAEWYYECSVEELKRFSLDANNENSGNILKELYELDAILRGTGCASLPSPLSAPKKTF
jgi:hypothetical protein